MMQKRCYFQHNKNGSVEAVPMHRIQVFMQDRHWSRISRKEYFRQMER